MYLLMKCSISLIMKKTWLFFLCAISIQVEAAIWSVTRPANPDLPGWVSFDYSQGRLIHVDVAGVGDNSDGSIEHPFTSIGAALQVAKPNDEIIIAPGEYRESLRIRAPSITLRSASLHQARIINPYDDPDVYFALRIDAAAHNTRIIGLDISGGYYYTVSLESEWSGSASGKEGVQYVLLSQNRLHGSGRDVVKLKPLVKHVVIERNEIFDSGKRSDQNAEGIDNVNAHYLTVQDNFIHNTATTAIYVKGGASHSVIQRNYIRDAGFGGILVGFDTSPDFFDLTINPEMFEALQTVVKNNIINGTGAAGIGVYAAKDTTLLHNTVLNAAKTHHAALFFGNTLQNRDINAQRPPAENIRAYGNVFHSIGRNPVVSIRFMQDRELGALSALKGMPLLGANLYASAQGSVSFTDTRPDSNLTTRSLQNWQQHTGSDHGSRQGRISLGIDYLILVDDQPAYLRDIFVEDNYYGEKREQPLRIGAM